MPFGTHSAWQYSRWVYNASRNYKVTEPIGADLVFLRTYLWIIGDPNNAACTRPWLREMFWKRSVCQSAQYEFDIAQEPTHVLVELLGIVGRDFKKIPITDFEVVGTDILLSLANNRQYGTGPYFGSTSGSTVTIV